MALFERQTDGGFIVALPFENAFPLLVQEIQKLGWGVHMVDPTTGHIKATTDMSMLTYGFCSRIPGEAESQEHQKASR